MIEEFLHREERRRNKSLSKRFISWLKSDKAERYHNQLCRLLAKKGGEYDASTYLKKCEEAYKADDLFKKQDSKREKTLKQFQNAFEQWLQDEKNQSYQDALLNAKTDGDKELARLDAEKAFARANPHLLPLDYQDRSLTRIRPVRHAYRKTVDELSLNILEPGLQKMGMLNSELMRNWSKIVGQALSENCRPERIAFPPNQRDNGVLHLKCRSAFNTIVQHHSAQIIFRINGHFGYKAISEIRISKFPFASGETTGEARVKKLMAARTEITFKEEQSKNPLYSGIKDEELKKAFEELGQIIAARNNKNSRSEE